MQLYYTPRSHFSRKVRILLAALAIEVELIDCGNVAEHSPEVFGPNPLMKVPTLLDGQKLVFDSDQICSYIVRRFDEADQYGVLSQQLDIVNTRSVMNGIMTAGVELVLGARSGIDINQYQRYDKLRATITSGLQWLEQHSAIFDLRPTYLGFHLTAMWDHLKFFAATPLHYPKLEAVVREYSALPFVSESRPV